MTEVKIDESGNDGSEGAKLNAFQKDLRDLVNKHNIESLGNIPDYMIAEFLVRSIQECSRLVKEQNKWIKVPEQGKIL